MPTIDLGALREIRCQRPTGPLVTVLSVSIAERAPANEESEAEALLAILADALEAIAEGTDDASARSIASEALAMFQGR